LEASEVHHGRRLTPLAPSRSPRPPSRSSSSRSMRCRRRRRRGRRAGPTCSVGGGSGGTGVGGGHKRSSSMDGATSSLEDEFAPPGVLPDYAKKVVPADKLVELALLYRERAKRGGKGWHGRGREGAAPTTVGARDGGGGGRKVGEAGFLPPRCWRSDFALARCKHCTPCKLLNASPILLHVVEVSLSGGGCSTVQPLQLCH
jgi:hypothetical protein